MKLVIRHDADSASYYVARHIIRRIKDFAPTAGRRFVLGLPTGSSPERTYHHLVQAYRAGEISFAHVVTFNMDEYVGLPEEHPESYHSFMYKHFFSHVDVPPAQVHILDGNAPDLAAECAAYERRIKAAGGIDLFLGGVGADGHIAFNEPGSSLRSRTRVATLAEDTVRMNSRFFGHDLALVPRRALTVGVATIMDAHEVVLIVTGPAKAVALQRTVEGGVSQMTTASCLQMHEEATIVCDDAATDELQVKTVKYFKSIEQVESDVAAAAAAAATNTTLLTRSVHTHPDVHTPPRRQKSGALRSLRIDTSAEAHKHEVPADELTPDSMSSRLGESAGLASTPERGSEWMVDGKVDELEMSPMHARVGTLAV